MKHMNFLIIAVVLAIFIWPAHAASTAHVQIQNYQYQPAQITIQKGDTVTWTNMDAVGHDVDFKDSESPLMKHGETYSKTFDRAGTFDYLCSVHPGMKGKVTVT